MLVCTVVGNLRRERCISYTAFTWLVYYPASSFMSVLLDCLMHYCNLLIATAILASSHAQDTL